MSLLLLLAACSMKQSPTDVAEPAYGTDGDGDGSADHGSAFEDEDDMPVGQNSPAPAKKSAEKAKDDVGGSRLSTADRKELDAPDEPAPDAEEAPTANDVALDQAEADALAGGDLDGLVGAPMGAPTTSTGTLGVRGGGLGGGGTGVTAPMATKTPVAQSRPAPPPPPLRRPSPQARTDWGATTWLSNDDAMSLASAQRLLWAVEHGQSFTSAQIRPHEFLNYFSFDTPDVARGDTFALAASAERVDGDTLAMQLTIHAATPPRGPLHLTLVVDRSGSMADANKMSFLKRGLHRMTSHLHPGDTVDVVSFDDRVETPLTDFRVGRDDTSKLDRAIDSLYPRGSTDLDAGLRQGYALARRQPADGERRVLVITDALLNTGDIDPDLVSEIGHRLDDDGIRLSAVGVGADVNDAILDELTEKGKGAYVFLGSEPVVDRVFGAMFPALTETVAENVQISLDLPDSLGMERFYGEEASTTKSDVQPVMVQAGTTQVYLEDLRIRDGVLDPSATMNVHFEWTDPATRTRRSAEQSLRVADLMAADTRDLDKARALMAWTDELVAWTHGQQCGDAWSTWGDRYARVGNDAELAWLDGLVAKTCGERQPVATRTAPFKVKVDSDQVIAEVHLDCPGRSLADSLSASDTVARFEGAPAGACRLTLYGATPMVAQVRVPEVGGETRCRVRAGSVDCDG